VKPAEPGEDVMEDMGLGIHQTGEGSGKNSTMNHRKTAFILVGLFVGTLVSGCVVPQPRGEGTRFLLREPQSKRAYYIYLPEGYTPSQVWPVVLSLHGMKPFDHAESQELEWESVADKYKMIVVAPDLANSDLLMEYPLKNVAKSSVQKDERIVVRILQDLIKRCSVDETKIFATSWSSGGYLLHYIVGNNPELFAGLCARGSCFSLEAMEKIPAAKIKKLEERQTPVMIYYGSNDIPVVRKESAEAVEWYKKRGIPVKVDVVRGGGHERVPDLAAAFFASHGGTAKAAETVEIVASYERGIAPFWVNFRAKLPDIDRRDYDKYRFAWYINGKLQGTEPTLFATLYKPDQYVVSLEVISPANRRFEAAKTVHVLPRQVATQ